MTDLHGVVSDVLIVGGLSTIGYGLYTIFGKGVVMVWGGVWLFLYGLGFYYEYVEQ